MILSRFILLAVAFCPLLGITPELNAQQSIPSAYRVCSKTTPPDQPCATPPRVVHSVTPEYSDEARSAKLQGTVLLYAVVGPDGSPHDIKIARALGKGLDRKAIEAVEKWRFSPGEVNGKAADVAINVEIKFHLEGLPFPQEPVQDYPHLFDMARSAFSNHEYDKCLALLQQIVATYPNRLLTWNLMGLAYLELDDVENAKRAFLQEINLDHASLNAYNNLGRAFLRERKFPEAIAQFRKQLELNPNDRYSHSNLAYAFFSMRKYSEAVPELLLGLQAQPENAALRIHLAECYLNTGQHEKAINELQTAVAMASNSNVWNGAAWALARSRTDLGAAQNYANTAMVMDSAVLKDIVLDPLGSAPFVRTSAFLSALDTLGWIEFLRGDAEHGLQHLLKVWQYDQEPVVAAHLAEAYRIRGDDRNAIRYSALAIIAAQDLEFPSIDDEDAVSASQDRLHALAESKYDDVLANARKELDSQRNVTIPNTSKHKGDAEFVVLVGNHKAPRIRFVRGEESLKDLESAIVAGIPSSQDEYEIVRWSELHCEASTTQCHLTMLPARKGVLAQRRGHSATITLQALADSNVFGSASLGMRFAVPGEWAKISESYSPQQGSDFVLFSKLGTLATLVLSRQHLEVNPEMYLSTMEEGFKKHGNYHRLSVASVVRDGLEGKRLIYNAQNEGGEWYGFVEVFTVGDQHYLIIGQSPRDMYQRYAAEFDNALRSLSFPMHHVSRDDLQANSH